MKDAAGKNWSQCYCKRAGITVSSLGEAIDKAGDLARLMVSSSDFRSECLFMI